MPLKAIRDSRSNASAPLENSEVSKQRIRTVARIVRIIAQHGIPRPNCLQQSMVLWWLLGRNRIESEIKFGARKENGQLKAHAWVECFGFALNEHEDVCRHYSTFEGVAANAHTEVR